MNMIALGVFVYFTSVLFIVLCPSPDVAVNGTDQ